jgi:hypothetical protein
MNKFINLLTKTQEVAKMAELNITRLKDELSKATTDMEQKQRDLIKLKTIQSMAGWTGEHRAYNWTLTKNEASTYSKLAWSEVMRFKTSTLEFCIIIKERTNLKKLKWEVNVTGICETLRTASYKNDGYRDHDYIKDMYMKSEYINFSRQWRVDPTKGGLDVLSKFKSEAEARAYATAWRERLMADHADEIAFELELVNELRAEVTL